MTDEPTNPSHSTTDPATAEPATTTGAKPRRSRRRPPSRRRRLVALGLLVAYLLVVMYGGVVDRLILFPETDRVDAPGATRVEVPVPGRSPVEAYVLRAGARAQRPSTAPASASSPPPAGEPAAFLLSFNGNADRAEYAVYGAEAAAGRRPVEVWAVNYPGYGSSPGPARLAAIPPAALAAYDAVAAEAHGRPIVVAGVSLGTAAALHVARNRPVAGLYLTNPPPLRQLIRGRHGWWNLWLLAGPGSLVVPSELGSLDNAAGATCPAVFVSSGADRVVPPEYQQRVIDAYAGPKWVVRVPEADHNDPPTGPAAAELGDALKWLWDTVGVPAPATRPTAP